MNPFKKILKILGKLTDLLNIGREQGWWDKAGNYHKGKKPIDPKDLS